MILRSLDKELDIDDWRLGHIWSRMLDTIVEGTVIGGTVHVHRIERKKFSDVEKK